MRCHKKISLYSFFFIFLFFKNIFLDIYFEDSVELADSGIEDSGSLKVIPSLEFINKTGELQKMNYVCKGVNSVERV